MDDRIYSPSPPPVHPPAGSRSGGGEAPGPPPRSRRLGPAAVLLSTLLWGTLWIPLRALREVGAGGPSTTALGFLLPLLVLLPGALRRGRRTLHGIRSLGPAGFWLALAIALYAEGLVRGPIARVILLFYLTPVWSTLLARVCLGEPIDGRRRAAIALGLAGMLVLFGPGAQPPLPHGLADGMGLAAGLSWAVALVGLRRATPGPLFDHVLVLFLFLAPCSLLVALLPGGRALDLELPAGSLGWLLALALLWMLPVAWLTALGARLVEPGRFAILLLFEVVVGLATATGLTAEPFGLRELGGTLLVLGAIGCEIRLAPGPSPA